MPKSIRRVDPEVEVNLAVRVPGWLKNEVVEYLEGSGEGLSEWFVSVLRRALREGWGVAEPPRAVRPLPTTGDEVRAWAVGERLLGPCGREWPCGAVDVVRAGGLGFCGECGIRVG